MVQGYATFSSHITGFEMSGEVDIQGSNLGSSECLSKQNRPPRYLLMSQRQPESLQAVSIYILLSKYNGRQHPEYAKGSLIMSTVSSTPVPQCYKSAYY